VLVKIRNSCLCWTCADFAIALAESAQGKTEMCVFAKYRLN